MAISSRLSIAHAIRAFLFASATVAIFRFRLSDNAFSHWLRLSVLF
jgi:hypothetical protein